MNQVIVCLVAWLFHLSTPVTALAASAPSHLQAPDPDPLDAGIWTSHGVAFDHPWHLCADQKAVRGVQCADVAYWKVPDRFILCIDGKDQYHCLTAGELRAMLEQKAKDAKKTGGLY